MGQQAVRNDGLFTGPALNQITLPAADYAASVAFYTQVGLTQIVDSPDTGYARFEAANGVPLPLHPSPPDSGQGAPGAPTSHENGSLDDGVAYLMTRERR